jgi:hypothetical protein
MVSPLIPPADFGRFPLLVVLDEAARLASARADLGDIIASIDDVTVFNPADLLAPKEPATGR